QAEDGIRDRNVTGVQTCALPIFEQQHGEIRAKLEAAIDNISRTKTTLQTIKRDYDAVDESFTFPVDGDQQITRHHKAMQRGENEIGRASCRERERSKMEDGAVKE